MTLAHSADDAGVGAATALGKPIAFARSWVIVAFLFGFMVINYADRTALGLAAGPVSKAFHLSPSQFGAVGSAFFLFYSLSALSIGFLINRAGPRFMLTLLAGVWSLAQLPLLAFANFGVFLGTRVLLGIGEGPASSAAVHTAYQWFPNERRTLPASIIAQGSAVGGVVAAPVIGWMIFAHGWQFAFGALGIIGALWTIGWWFVGAEGPVTETVTSAGARLLRVPYRRLLLNPTVWATWLTLFAGNWAIAMVVVWFPSYLRAGLQFSDKWVGLCSALPWAAGAIVTLAVGWQSQRMLLAGRSSRQARVLFVCLTACAGALALFVAPLVPSVAAKLVLVTLGVALPNACVSAASAIIGEVTPVDRRGAILSIGNAVSGSAGLFAPYLAGLLIQSAAQHKLPALGGFEAAFLLCGAVVLVANVVGLVFIRPAKQAEQFAAEQ